MNITDDELKKIFGRYGQIEDIDVKRPPPNSGKLMIVWQMMAQYFSTLKVASIGCGGAKLLKLLNWCD